MVNIEKFIERLEIILKYYGLSASAFADKINVQRSSLSHLLSGRNKPSLDFILKISEEFPEVSLEWILNGKGSFPKEDIAPTPTIVQPEKKIEPVLKEDLFSNNSEEKNEAVAEKKITHTANSENHSQHEIERIVVFFKDGTFKSYIH